jgi:predicted lipoprotein with Yx(FWY)xxD motif
MVIFRRSFAVTLFLAIAMLIAACGGSSSNPPAPTRGYGNNPPPAPTTSGSAALIHITTATVNGKSETILTNAGGMTLYYRTSDVPPTTVCSAGCAQAWPPLLSSGSGVPSSMSSLPGKLSVLANANGMQVEYNGHPLYTFSGDSGPAQTNGEGVGGIWFVVTPTLS